MQDADVGCDRSRPVTKYSDSSNRRLARVPIHDMSAKLPKSGMNSCKVYVWDFNQTSKEDVALNDRLDRFKRRLA
jgi:hypothetical protein